MSLYDQVRPYTMAAPDLVHLVERLARLTNEEGVPGDMVECGSWNGGLSAIMGHYAAKSQFNRKVYVFDSFEGLPPAGPEDVSFSGDRGSDLQGVNRCVGSADRVREVFKFVGARDPIITKGWFQDTFPTVEAPVQIAMLILDSDWYASEKLVLEKFYHNVVPGGYVYFDDYHCWQGCHQACNEFFVDREKPVFNQLGGGMWLRKPSPKTDLVLAAVKQYGWNELKSYANSLERSGYQGTKVLFEDGISPRAKEELRARGWLLHNFRSEGTSNDFIVRDRFVPVVGWLAENHYRFNNVIWTDVKDLVFQTDPSKWLADNPHDIVGAHEGWLIRDEHYANGDWQLSSYPEGCFPWLKNEKTLNGGTLAGRAESVYRALAEVLSIGSKFNVANDQSSLNYVLRTTFKDTLYIPKYAEGWAAVCAAFRTPQFHSAIEFNPLLLTDEVPMFDREKGMVFTQAGVPFCIVHMFDRDPSWIEVIQEKYK